MVYEDAIEDSLKSNHSKALFKFEKLLLNPLIHESPENFQIIDVRYQSIVRPSSAFRRANKIYSEILKNNRNLDYVISAHNFNQALLIKIDLVKNVEDLMHFSNIRSEVIKEYRKLIDSLFIEGSQKYKSDLLKNTKTSIQFFAPASKKYWTETKNSESTNTPLNDIDILTQNFISQPDNIQNTSLLLANIKSVQDIQYIKDSIAMHTQENSYLEFMFNYLQSVEKSIKKFYVILKETREIFVHNPNNEYIATTVSFLEFLAPFVNVEISQNTLKRYSNSISDYDHRKRSVNHHLSMLKSWSSSPSFQSKHDEPSKCKCDLGFWSIEYSCF